MRIWQVLLVITFFAFNLVHAQQDAAFDEAMNNTQDLLRDQKQRQELFKKDSKAKSADDRVQALTGGNAADSQKIYDISGDAFTAVMQSVGNDPNKMMELLQKAQGNPEAFYNSLPPELRQKIKGVASDIHQKGAIKGTP